MNMYILLKELQWSIWLRNSPDPNVIQQPLEVLEKLQPMVAPLWISIVLSSAETYGVSHWVLVADPLNPVGCKVGNLGNFGGLVNSLSSLSLLLSLWSRVVFVVRQGTLLSGAAVALRRFNLFEKVHGMVL